MDFDRYTPKYFFDLLKTCEAKERIKRGQIAERVKAHLFETLRGACSCGEASATVSYEKILRALNDRKAEKYFSEVVERDVVPYFQGRGFRVSVVRAHLLACDCGAGDGGCSKAVEIGLYVGEK